MKTYINDDKELKMKPREKDTVEPEVKAGMKGIRKEETKNHKPYSEAQVRGYAEHSKKKTSFTEPVRLNKYLSACGVCSRREADRLIEQGRVEVDGVAADMGMKVTEKNDVRVDGKPVLKQDGDIILAVCKPMGIVCTTARHTNEENIVDMLDYPVRVFPVGRLDKMSEGLILMTNMGDISDKILRGSNRHEKEYQVHISCPVTEDLLERLRSGVPILDTVTRPCKAWKTGEKSFNIVLTQGLNRQIRRMCEACGVKVTHLRRIRVMNIMLGGMRPGEYRVVEGEEKRKLLSMLQ
jgi:pseudouridine synthase